MDLDYNALGFKCGIEIHQQLDGKKLFCNCPVEIRKGNEHFKFSRKLRASAGETGTADLAALYEMEKGKKFEYEGYHDITCLVEMDEEPPRPINNEALLTVLQVCKMLNAEIVDQIQVMRKIVVDGSNVSGFQRTALIGRDGYVEVDGKRIGIPTICLEEEACQVVKRGKDKDTYNISRLGIPLVEIATDASISSPEECKKVAAKLGMILRSTGRMKRGLGSIRQDVNLSIKGGSRVEIKGFQDLKSIPKVIENEVKRQLKELKKNKKFEGHVRKAESDLSTSYLRPMPGASRMYPETDIPKIITPKSDDIEIPKLLAEKAAEFEKKHKLPKGYGKQLVKADVNFDKHAKKYKNISPVVLADFFVKLPKDLSTREGVDINPEDHLEVLEKLDKDEIPKSALDEIVLLRAKGKKVDYSKYETMSENKLEKEIKKIVDSDPEAPIGALMGEVMKKLKGKVEGKKAMEILKKLKK